MNRKFAPGPLGLELDSAVIDSGTCVLWPSQPPVALGLLPASSDVRERIDEDVRWLAAIAYGEASTAGLYEEMAAIANVVVRQQLARGYVGVAQFLRADRSFAYAAHDGNVRFERLRSASARVILSDPTMREALRAARNALSEGGRDYSNGAYFWDGADIRSNYDRHPKVQRGIRFSNPSHNIYSIKERDVPGEEWWRNAQGQKTRLRGSWNYVFESTAAYGGSIFWRYSDDFLMATANRPHD